MRAGSRTWITAPWRVTLSDGRTKTVYAASESDARERVARMLARHAIVGLETSRARVVSAAREVRP